MDNDFNPLSPEDVKQLRDDIQDATGGKRWYDSCPVGMVMDGRVSRVEGDITEIKKDLREVKECLVETNKTLAQMLPVISKSSDHEESKLNTAMSVIKFLGGGMMAIFTGIVLYLVQRGGL